MALGRQPIALHSDAALAPFLDEYRAFLEDWTARVAKARPAMSSYMKWVEMPRVDMIDGAVFHRVYKEQLLCDRFDAVILGRGIDLKLYARVVRVTGMDIETNMAYHELIRSLILVTSQGPAVCTEVEDGGILPDPDNQPKLPR
jgi:hypothetical protein